MKKPPIQISWQAGAPPPELDEAALGILLAGFLSVLGYSKIGVSVLVADDSALRTLNARYRGQDRPTDILSWSYLERGGGPAPGLVAEPGAETELLGELAVSLDRVCVQAGENGWDMQTELLRLLAHGCAHLAGYDHETEEGEREMRAVENSMLDKAGLPSLYPQE